MNLLTGASLLALAKSIYYFHTNGKAVAINTHSSLRLVSSLNTRRGSLVIWLDDKYLFQSKKYILKTKTKKKTESTLD